MLRNMILLIITIHLILDLMLILADFDDIVRPSFPVRYFIGNLMGTYLGLIIVATVGTGVNERDLMVSIFPE